MVKLTTMRLLLVGIFFTVFTASVIQVANVDPASAHGVGGIEASNSKSIVKSVSPKTTHFTIESVENGERVKLTRKSNTDIVVLGIDGEPYILIDDKGTFLNEKSATRVINKSTSNNSNTNSDVEFKKTTSDKNAAPKWIKESSSQTFTWHDHRAHYMGSVNSSDRDLGTNSFEIMAGTTKHKVTISFITSQPVNTSVYLLVSLLAAAIIISAFFVSKIAALLFDRKVLLLCSMLIVLFETIHILGYMSFSAGSLINSSGASLYGLILIACAIFLTVKLMKSELNKVDIKTDLEKRAPLLCVVGFLGLSAGALIEYKSFTYRFPPTVIEPVLSRMLIATVGLISLNLLVAGIKFMIPNNQEHQTN